MIVDVFDIIRQEINALYNCGLKSNKAITSKCFYLNICFFHLFHKATVPANDSVTPVELGCFD